MFLLNCVTKVCPGMTDTGCYYPVDPHPEDLQFCVWWNDFNEFDWDLIVAWHDRFFEIILHVFLEPRLCHCALYPCPGTPRPSAPTTAHLLEPTVAPSEHLDCTRSPPPHAAYAQFIPGVTGQASVEVGVPGHASILCSRPGNPRSVQIVLYRFHAK